MKNTVIAAMICFGMLCFAFTMQAQPGSTISPEMRAEVKEYFFTEITPVLSIQRAKLEAQMTEEDRQQIDQVRLVYQELKSTFKSLRKEIKSARQQEIPLSETQQQALSALRQTRHTQEATLRTIAQKYQEPLRTLMEEIREDQNQWKTDLKEIRQRHLPETEGVSVQRQGRLRLGRGMRKRFILTFLLMKPEESVEQASQEFSRVFPNPGADQQQIVYQLDIPGEVVIRLLDNQGQEIRQFREHVQTSGMHQKSINLEGLQEGVYYYVVEYAGKKETRRILIQK